MAESNFKFLIRFSYQQLTLSINGKVENEFDKCFFHFNETANIRLVANLHDKTENIQIPGHLVSPNFDSQINCNLIVTMASMKILTIYQKYSQFDKDTVYLIHDGKRFTGNLNASEALTNKIIKTYSLTFSDKNLTMNPKIQNLNQKSIINSMDELIKFRHQLMTPSTNVVDDEEYENQNQSTSTRRSNDY